MTANIIAIEAALSVLVERAALSRAERDEILRRCRLDEIGKLADGTRNAVERIFSGADVLSRQRSGG